MRLNGDVCNKLNNERGIQATRDAAAKPRCNYQIMVRLARTPSVDRHRAIHKRLSGAGGKVGNLSVAADRLRFGLFIERLQQ